MEPFIFNKQVFIVEFIFLSLIFFSLENYFNSDYSINNLMSKTGKLEHLRGITLKTILINLENDFSTYQITGYKKQLIDFSKIQELKKGDSVKISFFKKESIFDRFFSISILELEHKTLGKILDFDDVCRKREERASFVGWMMAILSSPSVIILYSWILSFLLWYAPKKYKRFSLHPFVGYKLHPDSRPMKP